MHNQILHRRWHQGIEFAGTIHPCSIQATSLSIEPSQAGAATPASQTPPQTQIQPETQIQPATLLRSVSNLDLKYEDRCFLGTYK